MFINGKHVKCMWRIPTVKPFHVSHPVRWDGQSSPELKIRCQRMLKALEGCRLHVL